MSKGEEIRFDLKKCLIVSIDKVRPNTWNPKADKTPEYERIKKGIDLKGLRMPIVVRQDAKGYEIIDGEQRYTACLDLGFKKVLIYNEGKVSDQEAKELTLWYQQQVPFNEIDLANLLKEMSIKIDPKLMETPYSAEEIDSFIKLTDFNWNAYKEDTPSEKLEQTDKVDMRFLFTKAQEKVILEALELVKKNDGSIQKNEQGITAICKSYLNKDGK